MIKHNSIQEETNEAVNKIICEECKLKSVDISKEDLKKHNDHILKNKNIEIRQLIENIHNIETMVQQKCVLLNELCYICNLTKDIEDLCK